METFRSGAATVARGMRALDPRAKLITFPALIVICVSSPPGGGISFAGYFLYIALLLPFLGVSPIHLAKRMAALLPFILMMALFLPFMKTGSPSAGSLGNARFGLTQFWSAAVKAGFGAACAVILSGTTPFPDILAGLERMRMPRILTATIGFAYRYLWVLKAEAARMKRARDSRGYRGRWLWEAPVIGQMAGTLFIRGYERGERVSRAMAARGFTGRFPDPAPRAMAGADFLFIAVSVGLFLLLRGYAWVAG